jgi:hypothetical protein
MMNEPTDEEIKQYFHSKLNAGGAYTSCVATVRHFLEKQKPETGDMLSFDEWQERWIGPRVAFEAARQGMIALPPESEWPEWATNTIIVFCEAIQWLDEGSKDKNWKADGRIRPYAKSFTRRTKPQPIKMSRAEALERLAGVMGKPVEITE